MRKLMLFVAILSLVVSALPASADEPIRHVQNAVVGEFEYPWLDREMVIWPADGDSIMASDFAGIISNATYVKVVNRQLERANLDLLTGERVFAVGSFHTVGEGEGSKTYCDSLTVYLLPREATWAEKKFTEASVGWVRADRTMGLSVWPTEERTGGTYFAGELTANTAVKVHGRSIKRNDLDLLDGEYIACLANFRNEGQGEGSQRFIDQLEIWFLSRPQY